MSTHLNFYYSYTYTLLSIISASNDLNLQVEGDGEDGELCSDMDDDEEEEDLNNCALRRSSRLRQKPYRFRPMAEEITSHGPGDSSNVGGNERGKRQRPSDPPDNPDEVTFVDFII